jgi:hypothetical protein
MQTWFLAKSVQQGSIPELDRCWVFVVVMVLFRRLLGDAFYGRCGNVCIICQPYAHAHYSGVTILPSHQFDRTVAASLQEVRMSKPLCFSL